MSTGKERDDRKERQWRRWLREWRGSGLTVRAFCGARGLSEPSFYSWRRELAERDEAASAALFVPVQVVADEASAAASVLEVVVSGKHMVRVRPGFDAATLRQLLAVLEDKPC